MTLDLKTLLEQSERTVSENSWVEQELKAIGFLGLEEKYLSLLQTGIKRSNPNSSSVAYLIGITDEEPATAPIGLKYDPGRADWPDVDIDIEKKRRDEVKQYLVGKYGHVGSITNINTYKGKKALKDAARVIGVPYAEVNKTMKVLEGIDEVTGHDVIAEFRASKQAQAFNQKYPDVTKIAEKLYGRINGYGMHAAGIIIANVPISDYAPIETRKPTGSDDRIEVVALDKDECESIGLIKMDLLGLETLSVVDDAIRLIRENQGILIDIDAITLDDPKVFRNISEGRTLGIFQAEKPASTKLIVKMGIDDFNDLVVSNALVRPGAWNAIGEDYLAFKKGTKRPKPIHPDVEEYMLETFYQPVYQEQMMKMSVDLAGFTVGESNVLRKGIGKKKREIIDAFKPKFIEGASQKVSETLAEKLWTSFEEAGAYAFNKSHAVAYSVLSYQTAWLKAHYPLEFMCALLQNESNNETITDYLLECKNMGISIKLPHVNRSESQFSIDGDGLRMGLSGIKYISDKVAARIIAERPYKNYAEFKSYVLRKGSGLNTRVLSALNSFGGASFDDNPVPENYRDNLYEYLGIPAFDSKMVTARMRDFMTNLEDYNEDETFVCMAMVKNVKRGEGASGNAWCRVDMIDGTASAGAFTDPKTEIIKGQMYLFLIGNNTIQKAVSLNGEADAAEGIIMDFVRRPKFDDIPDGQYKVLAAQARKTSKGENMATVTVTDNQKNLKTLVVWSNTFDKVRLFCHLGAVRAIDIGRGKNGKEFIKDVH
jgi:DNA-directed DNA polymerase III PolC